MTIAELFVNLGVKGTDSAGKALSGVKTGLGEVKSMSLEAKAAIIGVIYGLERMMSQSAQMGTSLLNFNTLTGISTRDLQQWQYAARQAGVSGDELAGSMKSVQNSMTNMLLGKGAPEGMAMLANKVGFDPSKARDTLYVMQQLQKFAQQVPTDVGNAMLKSFGLSEGTIAAMRRNVFTPDTFKKAPLYSENEVSRLNKVDVAWANLGQKIQMAFGHFTSKHGMQLISDLSKVLDVVTRLAEAFVKLLEAVNAFGAVSKVFEGWTEIFNGIQGVVSGQTSGADILKGLKEGVAGAGLTAGDKVSDFAAWYSKQQDQFKKSGNPNVRPTGGSTKNQNININQNLNFQHDGKDAKKTGDSVHKAVKDVYRQLQAQAQGS